MFRRLLMEQGFLCDDQRLAFNADDRPPYRGRLLHFHRGIAVAT
jgi:hypothetical protein